MTPCPTWEPSSEPPSSFPTNTPSSPSTASMPSPTPSPSTTSTASPASPTSGIPQPGFPQMVKGPPEYEESSSEIFEGTDFFNY